MANEETSAFILLEGLHSEVVSSDGFTHQGQITPSLGVVSPHLIEAFN